MAVTAPEGLCGPCLSKVLRYEKLKVKLNDAAGDASSCSSDASSASKTLKDIRVYNAPVDDGVLSSIAISLDTVSDNLTTLADECDIEIAKIKDACPGPKHNTKK